MIKFVLWHNKKPLEIRVFKTRQEMIDSFYEAHSERVPRRELGARDFSAIFRPDDDKRIGFVYFSEQDLSEKIVNHEAVHVAMAIYRMTHGAANFGRGYLNSEVPEETFSEICEEMIYRLQRALKKRKLI